LWRRAKTLASQAGAQILARGGSAVDAAIAANAVLGLVEPMMDGIGGDLFVLYWDAKTGKLTGLNASGPAPITRRRIRAGPTERRYPNRLCRNGWGAAGDSTSAAPLRHSPVSKRHSPILAGIFTAVALTSKLE